MVPSSTGVPRLRGALVAVGGQVTPLPPAQIPACAANAPGSSLGFWRRSGDRVRDAISGSAHVLHIVARSDDSSVLLSRDEARVLSALPDDATTVATGLGAVIHIPVARAQDVLLRFCELGLVQIAGTRRGKALYRLSSAGGEHFQRGIRARRAKPALLVVKSDRVRDVLSVLSAHGQERIKDLRDALGIAHPSMNALMQDLERKRRVTKVGGETSAPYELTDQGREALAEMMRPAASRPLPW